MNNALLCWSFRAWSFNMFQIKPLQKSPLSVPALDARSFYFELHQTTDSKHFSKFFGRISNMYTQGVDFIKLPSGGEFPNRKDYAITIEVAKHMALLSETANGKAYREYLIKFEEDNNQHKKNLWLINDCNLGDLTEQMMKVAKAYGLKGNQAILYADKNVKGLTGISLLSLGGLELPSENNEQILTPTKLGKLLDEPLSPIAVNKILAAQGLQEKVNGEWVVTESGDEYAVKLDMNKKHSDGAPIQQVKWKKSTLKFLK